MITSLLLCLLFSTLFAPEASRLTVVEHQPLNPYTEVYRAVKLVESGDREVINYNEGAYGRAQIRQCKLDEYNEATGSSFVLWDCMSDIVTERIFMWHMMQYNDIEIGIRRWNGSGPMTEIYLDKVKRYL
jgi:hypothetical protein